MKKGIEEVVDQILELNEQDFLLPIEEDQTPKINTEHTKKQEFVNDDTNKKSSTEERRSYSLLFYIYLCTKFYSNHHLFRGSGSQPYFQVDGVRRGYDIDDSEAIDLLIDEKLAPFEKKEDESEELEEFNEEEREKLMKVVGSLRRGSVLSLK